MITTLTRTLLFTVAMFLSSAISRSAAEPARADAAMSTKLIKAIEQSDYESFIADGDSAFKRMKKEQFQAVAAQLAPKLRAGFTISYLGDLKQQGYHVTLWKIRFKDGGDDALASLSMKHGKVGGFFIK